MTLLCRLRKPHAPDRDVPTGYSLAWGGTFKNLQEAGARLVVAVPVALVMIFVAKIREESSEDGTGTDVHAIINGSIACSSSAGTSSSRCARSVTTPSVRVGTSSGKRMAPTLTATVAGGNLLSWSHGRVS